MADPREGGSLRTPFPGRWAADRVRGFDLTAPQLLVTSFVLLVALGTAGFLLLPGLVRGAPLGFVDALFMATSAVCVTGLSVIDVSSRLTVGGQAWLLLLIQLGGLGMLTLATLTAVALGGRPSLEVEEAAAGPATALPSRDPLRLVRQIVLLTLGVEAVGLVALWVVWAPRFGAGSAAWLALFHSVSAFCNAGFTLFADSLVGFASQTSVLAIVGLLIVLGGVGFVVIEDVASRLRGRTRTITLHTRLVLVATAVLLAGATVLYALYESRETLAGLGWPDRLANAFFMAVTARTAGFNTVDYDALANPSLFLTLGLMWIGGAPGSTAGGVKVTTVVLVVLLLVTRLRGRRYVSYRGRTLPGETVQRAVGLAAGGLLLLGAAVFVLLATEVGVEGEDVDRLHLVRVLFEAQSALATVGLSMGVTDELTGGGRVVVSLLMLVGRIGPLAVLASMARRYHRRLHLRYAHEDVLVG